MRLIDADALRASAIKATGNTELAFDNCFPYWQFSKCIKEAPTINAVPVVRGEWKLYGNDDDSGMSYWCTACNFQLSEDLFYSGYKNGRWIENGVFKYCPNCGAKMEDKPCG